MLFEELQTHNAGSGTIPLPIGVTATAVYGGELNCYRYRLDWTWNEHGRTLLACMMNPSTATHLNGDRTLSWVYRWACANGFGKLIVVNADAYRCTDQKRLAEVEDPQGPLNLKHILCAATEADMICIGYGQPKVKAVREHGPSMVRWLRAAGHELHVWALSKDGTPKHPIYLPGSTEAMAWSAKS